MLEISLVSAMILLYTLQSLFCRMYTEGYPGEESNASSVFTVVSGLTVALITFGFAGFSFSAKPLTLLFAVLNAVALFGYNYFIIKASQCGSYSVMMVFLIAGGIVIPAIVAKIAFGDEISLLKILAMLVVFVSVYLVSYKKEEKTEEKRKARVLFLLICTGLAVCNGAYGTFIDVQQRITGVAEKEEMVILTFLFAALSSLVTLAVSEKKKTLAAFRQSKKSLLFLIACSIVCALAINVFVYVLKLVDLTVLYTFDNAGVMLLSVIASCVFFKEKLTTVNVIGCVTMCLALVGVAVF